MGKGKIRLYDSSQDEILIYLPYDPNYLILIKKIYGRRWDAEKKRWAIPKKTKTLSLFLSYFKKEDPVIPLSLQKLLQTNETHDKMDDKRTGSLDRRQNIRSPITDRRKERVVEKMISQMKIRNYKWPSIKLYKNIIYDFLSFYNKPARQINNEEINLYLTDLVENRQVSFSRINQVISALKFLYEKMYKRSEVIKEVKRPRREYKLPVVINHNEVLQIIGEINYPPHKLMISLLYSSGFRISELVRLKVKDIDFENRLIFVRNGKGKKDRRTIFSDKLTEQLKKQIKGKTKNDWLFPGINHPKHYSTRGVQHILKRAVMAAGIQKDVHCHTLRHCFATHLLENGVDIRYIQELLGHSFLKTTEIYTRVRKPAMQKIKSPL